MKSEILFTQLESIDKHYTILSFSSNYKGCFGIIDEDYTGRRAFINWLPAHKTLEELLYFMCEYPEKYTYNELNSEIALEIFKRDLDEMNRAMYDHVSTLDTVEIMENGGIICVVEMLDEVRKEIGRYSFFQCIFKLKKIASESGYYEFRFKDACFKDVIDFTVKVCQKDACGNYTLTLFTDDVGWVTGSDSSGTDISNFAKAKPLFL